MAVTKTIVYLFAILVPLTLVQCQELQDSPRSIGFPGIPQIPGMPQIPGAPQIPGVPQILGLPRFQSPTNSVGPHDGDKDHQDRFFFHLPHLTSCNSNSEAGLTCLSCTQTLKCFPNNIGIVHSCHGFFRFCNAGHCSLMPGPTCSPTTTTPTSSIPTSPTSTLSTSTLPTSTSASTTQASGRK